MPPGALQACQAALHDACAAFLATHGAAAPPAAGPPHRGALSSCYVAPALRTALLLCSVNGSHLNLPPNLPAVLHALLSSPPPHGCPWPGCLPHAAALATQLLLLTAPAGPASPPPPALQQLFLCMQHACLPAGGPQGAAAAATAAAPPTHWLLQHEALQAVVAASRSVRLQQHLAGMMAPCLHPPGPGQPPPPLALALRSYSHGRVQPALLASLQAALPAPASAQQQEQEGDGWEEAAALVRRLHCALGEALAEALRPCGEAEAGDGGGRRGGCASQREAAAAVAEAAAQVLVQCARGGGVGGSQGLLGAAAAAAAVGERQAAVSAQLEQLRGAVQQLVAASSGGLGGLPTGTTARLLADMGHLASAVGDIHRLLQDRAA